MTAEHIPQPFPEVRVVSMEPFVAETVKLATYYWYERRGDDGRRIFASRDLDGSYRPAKMVVEIGFRTDFASIPRMVWPLISPWEAGASFLPHDVLYRGDHNGGGMVYRESGWWRAGQDQRRWVQDFTRWQRKEADDLMRFLMATDHRIPRWKRVAVYRAVRGFGLGPWKEANP